MADVILVYPFLDIDPNSQTKENYLLPLSLLYISTPLNQQNHNIHILDMRFNPDWKKELRNQLKYELFLCVRVSSMTGAQIKWGIEALKVAREISSNVRIVWGAVHPSLLPEKTIESE